MPKMRKYRRKTRKTRRGRAPYNPRVPRLMRDIIGYSPSNYYFKRISNDVQYTSINTPPRITGALKWKLSDVVNYSEFVALFDQYRINMIKVDIIWKASGTSQVESQNNNTVAMPILYHVIDLDDDTAPTYDSIRQYNKTHITYFSTTLRKKSIMIKPRYLNLIGNTGLFSTSSRSLGDPKAWIDVAYPELFHYGLKWVVDVPQGISPTTATHASFDVVTTYYLQFRQTR